MIAFSRILGHELTFTMRAHACIQTF